MSRLLPIALLLLVLAGDGFVTEATACPMCGQANESAEGPDAAPTAENARPKAYMYSILFMMGMPPMILGGFGLAFWRMAHTAHIETTEVPADESDTGSLDG